MLHTRRAFLHTTLLTPFVLVSRAEALVGQGLDAFTVPGVPCKDEKLTPAADEAATFRKGSPERSRLAEPDGQARPLVLAGSVRGLVCGPVAGAILDFWQADPAGKYDAAGFRFRGHQASDRTGRYRLETTVPGAAAGRAPHLCVRVQIPGKKMLATQLFLPDDPRNLRDPRFQSALLMTLKPASASGPIQATFDFVLDA